MNQTSVPLQDRRNLFRWLWAGALLYAALLTYLLLAPHPLWFLGEPGQEAEDVVDQTLADYAQHALAYSVLGVSLVVAAAGGTGPRAGVCLGLAATHGVLCEYLQHFIPHRYFGIFDVLANVVGVAAGGLAGVVLWRIIERRERNRRQQADSPAEPPANSDIRAAGE